MARTGSDAKTGSDFCVHLITESVFGLKILSKKVYAHPKILNFGNLKMEAKH